MESRMNRWIATFVLVSGVACAGQTASLTAPSLLPTGTVWVPVIQRWEHGYPVGWMRDPHPELRADGDVRCFARAQDLP